MWLVISLISAVIASPQLVNNWNLEIQTSEASSSPASGSSVEVKPDICITRCMINGNIRQACLSECKKKTQSEQAKVLSAPSKSIKENKCGSTCYTHCYTNNQLGQECFDSCLNQCKPRESEEFVQAVQNAGLSHTSLTATTCFQNCYLTCLVGGTVNQACFNECAGFCPPSESVSSKALTLVPTNCGQICFQQCYVNFQMIANCYLPCVDSCLSTTVSQTSVSSSSGTRADKPVPSNECEWECFVSSWSDSFFYEAAYTKCSSSLCISSSLKSESKSAPSVASSCISSCRKVGKVDAKCFDACLHRSDKIETRLEELRVIKAETSNLVL